MENAAADPPSDEERLRRARRASGEAAHRYLFEDAGDEARAAYERAIDAEVGAEPDMRRARRRNT